MTYDVWRRAAGASLDVNLNPNGFRSFKSEDGKCSHNLNPQSVELMSQSDLSIIKGLAASHREANTVVAVSRAEYVQLLFIS